jgi:hypothetical protein
VTTSIAVQQQRAGVRGSITWRPARALLFGVCRGSVIMITDLRICMRVGRCGSWLPLADFWGVGGLQPRVAAKIHGFLLFSGGGTRR